MENYSFVPEGPKTEKEMISEALNILKTFDFNWGMSDDWGAGRDAERQMRKFVSLAAKTSITQDLRSLWIANYERNWDEAKSIKNIIDNKLKNIA